MRRHDDLQTLFPLAAGMLGLFMGCAAFAQSSDRVNFAAGNDNAAVEAWVTGHECATTCWARRRVRPWACR